MVNCMAKDNQVNIRMNAEEKALIEKAAAYVGISCSAFIRMVALREAEKHVYITRTIREKNQ